VYDVCDSLKGRCYVCVKGDRWWRMTYEDVVRIFTPAPVPHILTLSGSSSVPHPLTFNDL
jgi:hypothetical protein